MYSSVALKSGGMCTFGPPRWQKVGVRTPTGSPLLIVLVYV